MMEPIISPWIFYWIDVADALKVVLVFVSFLGFVAVLFYPILADEFESSTSKVLKSLLITIAVSIAFTVFIPSEDTMYKMLVTSYITPNNIELVGGSIDTALDKLTDKVVKIKEAK